MFNVAEWQDKLVPVIYVTYVIAAINSFSLTSLYFILSLQINKTKKKQLVSITEKLESTKTRRLSCGGKLTDRYKALIAETPCINVKYVFLKKASSSSVIICFSLLNKNSFLKSIYC